MVKSSKGFSYAHLNSKDVRGVFFDYLLKPLRTGLLKIPRQVFRLQGEKYIVGIQAVEVVPGSLPAARQAIYEKKFIFDTDTWEPLPGPGITKVEPEKIGIEDEVVYTLTVTGIILHSRSLVN